MQYHFITVEGNIGSGKTTLAKRLAEKLNARLILEEFADNPFLSKFYQNPEQYAFPVELFFMAERFKQLENVLQTRDLFHQITVSDYFFTKCLLFARANLPEDEFTLYQKLFDVMAPQLINPDIILYLNCPVEKLQENIKKRGRPFEQDISNEYLYKIQRTYASYFKQHDTKRIMIDASNADFLSNDKHVNIILDALNNTNDNDVLLLE